MTPRQAEVAFVLESVSGVRGVYAVEPGRVPLDFVIDTHSNPRVLAGAHFALLRVLTHAECERVMIFYGSIPTGIAGRLRPLRLEPADRDWARARVPAAPAWEIAPTRPSGPRMAPAERRIDLLVVDDDPAVVSAITEVFEGTARVRVSTRVAEAATVARCTSRPLTAILCDAVRAFGAHGFLASLPLEIAQDVIILATPKQKADALWRLRGYQRVLVKPITHWLLWQRVVHRRAAPAPRAGAPVGDRLVSALLQRSMSTEVVGPLRILFVDLDDETVAAFRAPFAAAAGESVLATPDQAIALALTQAFHLVVCSASTALHPTGFLTSVAREDPRGADRVLVLVPALDAAFVHEELAQLDRKTKVLALPLEESAVRREVERAHPPIATNVALRDLAEVLPGAAPKVAYRRLAVLVVDDDTTTEILFAASSPADSDISLATSSFAAFEHCMARPVDVLIVSASMRGDGGEPFYRVLWRLEPELKTRTVLIVAPDAMPPSAPSSTRPRILERPVSREAVARIAAAFRDA